MSTNGISIVDYGLGNLFSVKRALESCGAQDINIAASRADILNAHRLILPGVGAFRDGMQGLEAREMVPGIQEFAASGRPILGICLGMQLFATQGTEFGHHTGLGMISGQVVPIPSDDARGTALKAPYIGWSTLEYPDSADIRQSPLRYMDPTDAIYLVHSYHYLPDNKADILATYRYGGHDITAAIRRDNIIGLQFHPEKSGKVGLKILAQFIEMPV